MTLGPISPYTLRTVAQTIWGEARGEGTDGMIAVGWIICNRAAKPGWWGKTLLDVCIHPYQFSCWNQNDPNREKMFALQLDGTDLQFLQAYGITCMLLSSTKFPDPTLGSTYYHTVTTTADWAPKMEQTVQIGHQVFYKERSRG